MKCENEAIKAQKLIGKLKVKIKQKKILNKTKEIEIIKTHK
jgi:hypothetical protein